MGNLLLFYFQIYGFHKFKRIIPQMLIKNIKQMKIVLIYNNNKLKQLRLRLIKYNTQLIDDINFKS